MILKITIKMITNENIELQLGDDLTREIFIDYGNRKAKIIFDDEGFISIGVYMNDNTKYSDIRFNELGFQVRNYQDTKQISLTSDLENGCVRVECDSKNAIGLIGSHDFTENVSPLAFVQAKWVEDKIQEAISNL